MIIDVQFWLKPPFKWTNASSEILQDEDLVQEYLHDIWTTIKGQLSTLKGYGITGLKNMGEDGPFLEPDRQLWSGITSIRVWYFRK